MFAITSHPTDSAVVFVGANDGVYRSGDSGRSFERIEGFPSERPIWSVAFDPVEPDTVFAGGRPGAVFRSRDGGQRWETTSATFAEECPNVRWPRVLSMAVDPTDHRVVWAGAEVDGVRRSLDGGDTWVTVGAAVEPGQIGKELDDPDIHGIVVSDNGHATVFVSTPREIYASSNRGESWTALGASNQFPLGYCRGIAAKADGSGVLFVGNGDAPAGEQGAVLRSLDAGRTWDRLPLPIEPNTPIWTFAMNVADPELIFTCSHYGQVFASEDGGDSWRKIRREFSEIRAMAWLPN